MAREPMLLQVSADLRRLEKQMLERGPRAVDQGSTKMERRAKQGAQRIERYYSDIDIGGTLSAGSRVAQLALAGVSVYAIKLASDAAEIESAFDVAFKGSAKSAREFSNVLGERLGRDAVETRQAMTRLQLVLTGTGVAADQATGMVQKLVEAGIDAGSLFNTSDAEAFQKIISGLTGETEPLKAFGVVVNETAVKAELLRLGFKGSSTEASEAAKSVARANLILQGLAVAQGDAARTSGSAANQAKRLRAEANAAARELGDQLLPAVIEVTKATTGMLRAFSDLPGGVQIAGLAILAFIAAGGPLGALIRNMQALIKLAGDARVALAGVAGANAAVGASGVGAGIGGLAAGGIAAGGALAIPAVAGAVIADPNPRQFRRTVKAVDKATDEALAASVNFARGNLARIAKSNAGAGADALVKKLNQDLVVLTGEQAKRAAAKAGAAPAAAPGAKVPGAGGFTLSPEQLKPRAGGGGGKRGAGQRDVSDEQAAQIAQQVAAAEADVLRARLELAGTAEERAALEKQLLGKAAEQEDARLKGAIAALADRKGLDAATKAQLTAEMEGLRLKNAEVRALQEQAINQQLADEQARAAFELKSAEMDGQEELLRLQGSMARTDAQRLKIEFQLLDLAEKRAEAELKVIEATLGVASIEYQIAAKRLEDLRARRPIQEDAARRDSAPAREAGQIAEEVKRKSTLLEDTAAMYAEIERLRQEDVLSEEEAAQARAEINARYHEQRLEGARSFFGNLATLSDSSNKTLAAIGKAAAIAQATIDGILAVQKALASAPPPFNFALAAAAGVAAAVNVSKIAGMADGGPVRGPGGPREDRVPVLLSNGEFVVNARDAGRNLALLQQINAGAIPRLAAGGPVGPASAAPPRGGDSFNWYGDANFNGAPLDTHIGRRQTADQMRGAALRGMAQARRKGFG